MSDFYPFLFSYDRARHSRSQVIHYKYYLCRMLFQFAGESYQYTCHSLEKICIIYMQIYIGTRHI